LLARIRSIVTNVRRGEAEGVVWPLDYDDNGNELFKFELMAAPGARQFDTDTLVSRYDQRMLVSVLADFLLIGQEGPGGLGLQIGSDKIDLFLAALDAWMKMVAAEINDRLIPLLVRLNGWDPALAPRREPAKIQATDLTAIGAFLQALAASGAPLWPNNELLEQVLSDAGLPGPDPATAEAAHIGLELKVQGQQATTEMQAQTAELGPAGRAALQPEPPAPGGPPAAGGAKKQPPKKAVAPVKKAPPKKAAPPAPGTPMDRMSQAAQLRGGAKAKTR
jgi:hypothetical protein